MIHEHGLCMLEECHSESSIKTMSLRYHEVQLEDLFK
jgi:hypothetical protein